MLHHVALELRSSDAEGDRRFWSAVGFEPVAAPDALGSGYDWFERNGTQVHLVHRSNPVIPSLGHVAVVVTDLDAAVERIEALGMEAEDRRPLWGERRLKVTLPSGHRVELLEARPEPT